MSLFAIKRKKDSFVLIIKIGGIGDVIMALPLLSYLPKETHITWVVGKQSASLLTCIPQINNIVIVDADKLLHGNLFQKISATLCVWKNIFFKKFNQILIGHADKRYHLLCLPCFKKEKRAFSDPVYKMVPFRYHAYEYIRLATNKFMQSDQLFWPQLNIPPTPIIGQYDVIIAPGGNPSLEPGKELRRWPIHYYQRLVQMLIQENKTVAIIGGASDNWLYNYFDGKAIDLFINKFSIPELLSFFKTSRILVTHDSGPMHLGILSKIQVLALFGPTIPNEKIPHYVTAFWGGETLSCRPCYNGKHYAKCKKPICMETIQPIQILQTIQQILTADDNTQKA